MQQSNKFIILSNKRDVVCYHSPPWTLLGVAGGFDIDDKNVH
jgi:hypothetical protein